MISKEQFSKLPQLDRIEFRQRQDRILERLYSNLTRTIIFFLLGAFIVGSLFIGLCWGGEKMILFMLEMKTNIPFFGLMIIIGIIGDLIVFKKRNKSLDELFKEYFIFEVKIKKSKDGKRKQ